MDTRVAHERAQTSRPLPAIAALVSVSLFLFGASFARPASSQTGHYLGLLDGVSLSVQTDAGVRSTKADLDLVLDVGPRESRDGNGRSVSMHAVGLSAPGVATGGGNTGAFDGDLKASGRVPVAADGRVTLPVTVTLHYPLIDRTFPPSPEPYQETFGGTLTGTLAFKADENLYVLNGTLHLTVRGAATGKVVSLDVPLDGVEMLPDSQVAMK